MAPHDAATHQAEPGDRSPAPKVTVAIPTRTRAELLRIALRSALSQDLADIEVVVADNASTDRTADVVASFDDPRVRYAPTPHDTGLHANLSRCLEVGSAPYVTILQDDDFMLPGHLSAKVAALDAHPDAAVAHSRFHYVDERGGTLRADVDWTGGWRQPLEPGRLFVERSMRQMCRINLTSAVMRRRLAEGLAFAPADGLQTDVGLWLRLALRGDVAFIDATHTVRRVHPDAVSFRTGTLGAGGAATVARPQLLLGAAAVHDRFLAEHRAELGDAFDALRRDSRILRREGLVAMLRANVDETPTRASLSLLARAVRADPPMLGQPGTYWCLGAVAAGRWGRRAWRRVTARPVSAEVAP